jgi:hypothetical protein
MCPAVPKLVRLLENYATSLVYGVQVFWSNLPPPLYSLKTEAADLSETTISICHKTLIVTSPSMDKAAYVPIRVKWGDVVVASVL